MARIAGVVIPQNKRIEIALTYVYGIGRTLSNKILNEAKIDFNKRTQDLTEGELTNLKNIVEKNKVEGDLRRDVLTNVKRLKEINSYRGSRHKKGLPTRGKTNGLRFCSAFLSFLRSFQVWKK